MNTTLLLLIALALSYGFLFVAAAGYIHSCGKRPKK